MSLAMSRLIGIFFAEDHSDSFDFHRTKNSLAFRRSVSRTIKPHTDTLMTLMTALDTDIFIPVCYSNWNMSEWTTSKTLQVESSEQKKMLDFLRLIASNVIQFLQFQSL